MLYYIAAFLGWFVWRILFRTEYRGMENFRLTVSKDKGYILAPNHISAIDPTFIVFSSPYFWTHKMRVFAKKELFEVNPLISWAITQLGAVSVKNGRDDLTTLDKTIEEVKNGKGLLLFPEGTRSKDGALLAPKSGAFVVASAAGVDMLPCRILYDTPDGHAKLFCRVRVCFGEAIPAETLNLGEKRDMRRLRENKKLLTTTWQELGEVNCFPGRSLPAPAAKKQASAEKAKEE